MDVFDFVSPFRFSHQNQPDDSTAVADTAMDFTQRHPNLFNFLLSGYFSGFLLQVRDRHDIKAFHPFIFALTLIAPAGQSDLSCNQAYASQTTDIDMAMRAPGAIYFRFGIFGVSHAPSSR